MSSYKRVLLKLSGEALSAEKGTGFDDNTCISVGKQICELVKEGIEVAVVIGGGNFWRGRSSESIERAKADQIGMMATIMNSIYMSEICRYVGCGTQIFTPFTVGAFTELFSIDRVNECFQDKRIVFFAGGTGHPYFSTDTLMALRAVEIHADVILAAKSVNGVYDADPSVNPNARKYDTLTISQVIDDKLGFVDLAAAVLCYENKVPMMVFGLNEENSIVRAVKGKFAGTMITV
ncbi:MAG: UMP kinase [Lachnoclostridium sp.]|jgi:uridylate kinase|nr:UMP kinase [Lachnoclostridium sp.]